MYTSSCHGILHLLGYISINCSAIVLRNVILLPTSYYNNKTGIQLSHMCL